MEEDERRNAAIASNLSLRPNFKSSGITEEQLSKFRELQRRRLQLKSKSKNKKNLKSPSNAKGNFPNKDLDSEAYLDENNVQGPKDSSVSTSSNSSDKNKNSPLSSQVDIHPAFKKKKLHWGLDTKERWERKANM